MQNNCIPLISKLLLILLISCKSQNSKIVGKEYIYENSNRKFSVKIIDHKNLIINNTYNCTEISDKFKNISLNEKYKIIKNKIIILNPNQDIEIPYFDKSNCTYLTTEFRSSVKHFYDGRTIYPDESLYTFPKIDTLNIINNDSMYYYKKTKNGSIGFVFKQKLW